MDQKKNRNQKKPRQEWNPHWVLKLLYGIWTAVLGAAKIAVGAVATVVLICLVCMFVFVGILGNYLEQDILPEANYTLDNASMGQTSYAYYVDSNGDIQRLQQIHTSEDRQWAPLKDIPEDLIHAAVAIEDKRFYEHQGVDWITTVKACANMFFGSGDTFGGSTITQQLIKNRTGEKSVTVQRKVMEIFRAQQFEKNYDKDTIMEAYLNTIYLGRGKYGVKSAAAEYFGKELQMLTTAECASLISITNNPSIYSPYGSTFEWNDGEADREMTGKERNRIRQVNTLKEMCNQGLITREAYEEALSQEMVFKSGIDPQDRWCVCDNALCGFEGTVSMLNQSGSSYTCPNCGREITVSLDSSQEVYSYFMDTVLEDVAADLAAKEGVDFNKLDKKGREYWMSVIQMGGYHIYTTLDMDVQNAIDQIYTDKSQIAKTRSKQQLQSGMVVIDNSTGDIVGIGGAVGSTKEHDGWNYATDSKLQTGSSMKPIAVYAPAFEAGAISPITVIPDLPVSYSGGAFPKNDNRSYSYSRTVYSGIVSSVNAISVRTLRMIGYDYSYNFAKNKFGLASLTDHFETRSGSVKSDLGDSPLGMGALTVGATVREMSNAFSTFANDGVFRKARTYTKVYDSQGNLILDNVQESKQILSQKTVNYMNYCLTKAVENGTGKEARISGQSVAGKTGTTSSNKDRWFCGFTKYYTAAVWCGYDNPEVIRITSGENNPSAVLFRKVLSQIHTGKKQVSLYSTKNMRSYTMCLDSGAEAISACDKDLRTYLFGLDRTSAAYAYTSDAPEGKCARHVLVDYCNGGGVANEYCRLFADVDSTVEISSRALVKLTPGEVQQIKQASSHGLYSSYSDDRYVYAISESGDPIPWYGFNGRLEQEKDAPYLICPVHNKQAWEEYQASQETEPPEETGEELPPDTPED